MTTWKDADNLTIMWQLSLLAIFISKQTLNIIREGFCCVQNVLAHLLLKGNIVGMWGCL